MQQLLPHLKHALKLSHALLKALKIFNASPQLRELV